MPPATFTAPDGRTFVRPPPPEPPMFWVCEPDEIYCRFGHPHIRVRDDSMQVVVRAAGYLFLKCPKCTNQPGGATYAFGVMIQDPDEMVTFYAVRDREQFEALQAQPRDLSTYALLMFLGHVPDRRRRPR